MLYGKVPVALFACALLIGCDQAPGKIQVKEEIPAPMRAFLDELEGHWYDPQDSTAVFHERWERLNDTTLNGICYVLSGLDTVVVDRMSIHAQANSLSYRVRSTSRSQNASTTLALKHSTADTALFEATGEGPLRQVIYTRRAPSRWQVNMRWEGLEHNNTYTHALEPVITNAP